MRIKQRNKEDENFIIENDPWRLIWYRLLKNALAVFGLIIVVFYLFLAFIAPFLPLNSYQQAVSLHRNLPPSWHQAGENIYNKHKKALQEQAEKENRGLSEEETAELKALEEQIKNDPLHAKRYLLGTDSLGRDLFSRIIYGSRFSVLIGLGGAFLSIILGMLLGAAAGYLGGKTDQRSMALIEILYRLPYMLLIIIFMSLFGNHLINLFISIALISWLVEARVIRAQILVLKNSEFVQAARAMGADDAHIIFRHLIPNTTNTLIIFTTVRTPVFILSESLLSFLGLGVAAPMASWGLLVKDGMQDMYHYPWQFLAPAISMAVFLLGINALADGLKKAFSPKSQAYQ